MSYGRATDLLSLLIARIEGKPLRAVLKGRIFFPLGMKDTSFLGAVASSPTPQFAGIFLQALSFVFLISPPLNEFAILWIYNLHASFRIEEDRCADWQTWY